ncbi:aquaporin [Mariniblastus sp.]|nr:aquaporin [Mariniblastus sp.]
MWASLRKHWPEYLMEATELGLLVFMACASAAFCHHPDSPIAHLVEGHSLLQRLAIGVTMGLTMIAIIYSPMGKRSGAHINPAVTFTFFRLGKIHASDAFFYIVFQFLGGIAGAMSAGWILGSFVSAPEVGFATTQPGSDGTIVAFVAEFLISGIIMGTVLHVTNHKEIMHKSGLYVGLLFAIYITLEQPFSGTSMNPARSLGSAVMSGHWSGVWIYFTAPLLGMLLAGEIFLWTKGKDAIHCAKLYHTTDVRCIFKCGMANMAGENGMETHKHNRESID